MKLNLGCGLKPKASYVNVDLNPRMADVVHDLDALPWPFDDESAEVIVGEDVFEHVRNPVGFMTEAHRVLKKRGNLVLRTPHWQSEMAHTDPTHVRFPTEHTWDFWIPGTALYQQNELYGGVSFRRGNLQVVEGNIFVSLVKI